MYEVLGMSSTQLAVYVAIFGGMPCTDGAHYCERDPVAYSEFVVKHGNPDGSNFDSPERPQRSEPSQPDQPDTPDRPEPPECR